MFGPSQRNSNSHPSCRHRSQSSLWPFLLLPGDFLSLHHFRAALQRNAVPVCGIALALWAGLLLSLGSRSSPNSRCPGVLCGFCSPAGIKPGRGRVYPLCCPACGCLQVLQFHWESCYSCARDPALLGTQTAHGKSVKVLSVSVGECLGSLTPLQSAFIAPRTLSAVYIWKE